MTWRFVPLAGAVLFAEVVFRWRRMSGACRSAWIRPKMPSDPAAQADARRGGAPCNNVSVHMDGGATLWA